jgi:hypothetical protein
MDNIEKNGIIVDIRPFNEDKFALRAGLVAMYNTFADCDVFIKALC